MQIDDVPDKEIEKEVLTRPTRKDYSELFQRLREVEKGVGIIIQAEDVKEFKKISSVLSYKNQKMSHIYKINQCIADLKLYVRKKTK